MTDAEVAKRLEELKLYTKQSLNVEQRIEIARQQQALRDAKKIAKDDIGRSKEKVNVRTETSKSIENFMKIILIDSQYRISVADRVEMLKKSKDWRRNVKNVK